MRSTVDASVGFHIQKETADGRIDIDMMKRVLNLCQDHNDLHAKVFIFITVYSFHSSFEISLT